MWQGLFLSGEIASPEGIRRIANECDLLWAADGGLSRMLSLGLSPDYYVGDGDSVDNYGEAYLARQNIPRETFPELKDETDSALALHRMLKNEQLPSFSTSDIRDSTDFFPCVNGVVFFAAFGYRLDHVMANFDLAERYVRPDLPFLFTDGKTLIWTLQGPCTISLEELGSLAGDGRTYLSLLAVSAEVSGIHLDNVLWELENRTLFHGINLGVSNEIIKGKKAELSLERGILRVFLSVEDKEENKKWRYRRNL